jgi:hypothetical protein
MIRVLCDICHKTISQLEEVPLKYSDWYKLSNTQTSTERFAQHPGNKEVIPWFQISTPKRQWITLKMQTD